MNEAISALAASNTTETLHPVDVIAATVLNVVASAEKVENKVETNVETAIHAADAEVGRAESEIAKIEAEVKTETVAAEVSTESELQEIEDAALRTVTNVAEKVRNVFVDAEQFVTTEAKKIWHLPHNSVIKNPAILFF